MPLIALLDGDVRVDATVDQAVWAAVWRAKPPRDLSCRECSSRLTAVDRRGTRFFRHHRQVDCSTSSESPDHVRLKARLADAVRRAGWDAKLEEPVPPRQADVLAVSPEGHRLAVEIQLSPQLAKDTVARTRDYAAAEVDTLWVVLDPRRLGQEGHGASYLRLNRDDRVIEPLRRMRASTELVFTDGGHQRIDTVAWKPVTDPVDLDTTINAILHERAIWHAPANGWIRANELGSHEQRAANEAAARAELAQQELARKAQEQATEDRKLANDIETDPQGYATAQKVAKRLAQTGHGRPAIRRAGPWLAHAWLVQIGRIQINVDPDPARLDFAFRRTTGSRARTTARANLDSYTTVVSSDRHDSLCRELRDVQAIDEWKPAPAPLQSPDGRPVLTKFANPARAIAARIHAAFREPPGTAPWDPTQNAWIWTLPDGATVAFSAATGLDAHPTPTTGHRLVIYNSRAALPADDGRCRIWNDVDTDLLAGRPTS